MTVIINDEGFSTPEQEITYERADTLNRETRALDISADQDLNALSDYCLLYTSPSPRDKRQSRMPSSA